MSRATPPEHAAGISTEVPQNGDSVTVEDATSVSKRQQSLGLPVSSEDGLVKKPFSRPLDSAKPTPVLQLTKEQSLKYEGLLEKISSWRQVPDTLAKNAAKSELTDTERMFLTRECLLRYLRATKWNNVEAETRLMNTLSWRREYGVDTKLTPEHISIENETGKQLIMGYDKDARPCLYMFPDKQNTEKSDRQVEHLVFMLERLIDLLPPGQETTTFLINFAETKSGQGATIAQARLVLYILQNHYPERLGRACVTNLPFFIWGFFKLITPFIDPITKQKLRFNEEMSTTVPKEQLLKRNGGSVDFEYDHSEYWPALNQLAESRRNEYRSRWEQAGSKIGEHEDYLRGAPSSGPAESKATVESETKV
ncbi:MAG: hypothetical protein Q9160_003479 [Pyrenula sp. 1 TL-2023]